MKMTMFRSSILRVAILALGATALSTLPAMAQDPSAPPPPPQDQAGPPHRGQGGVRGHQGEVFTKKLELTSDQGAQGKAIEADALTQMKALHEGTPVARSGKAA